MPILKTAESLLHKNLFIDKRMKRELAIDLEINITMQY